MRRRPGPIHLLEVGVRWPPETFVGWKLEGLADRGLRVTVASKSVFDADARLRGVELLRVPVRGMDRRAAWGVMARSGLRLLLRPARLVRLVRGMRRVPPAARERYGGGLGLLALCLPLAPLRPDVVHFEWHAAAVDYSPLFDVWRCPVTTSARGSDLYVHPYVPDRKDYGRRLPEVLSRVSAVHCVSESLKQEAIRLGLAPDKARVIRPAADPGRFAPATRNGRGPDRALRVVTLGWLRWEKGHEYALEAVRAALDQGVPVHLEMIGGLPGEWRSQPREHERILHTIADLDLGDHVRLAGELPSAQVVGRLAGSEVLLHAAVTEGIPNAIVEAMACGLPIVASRCGGVPEVLADGVEGFLVPPRDPDALAGALATLWRDPALRARMGAAARTRALSGHTLEQEVNGHLAMYREVLAR